MILIIEHVTVFKNGETLAECIIASHELKKEGISVRVVNVPVVKPIDKTTIINGTILYMMDRQIL